MTFRHPTNTTCWLPGGKLLIQVGFTFLYLVVWVKDIFVIPVKVTLDISGKSMGLLEISRVSSEVDRYASYDKLDGVLVQNRKHFRCYEIAWYYLATVWNSFWFIFQSFRNRFVIILQYFWNSFDRQLYEQAILFESNIKRRSCCCWYVCFCLGDVIKIISMSSFLTKFSSLAALEFVEVTASAVSDENYLEMMTFSVLICL